MMNRCVYYTIVHIRLLETYSHCEDIAPRATAACLGPVNGAVLIFSSGATSAAHCGSTFGNKSPFQFRSSLDSLARMSVSKKHIGAKLIFGQSIFVWQSQIGTLRIRITEFGAKTHIYIDRKYRRWLDYWWMNDLSHPIHTWSLKFLTTNTKTTVTWYVDPPIEFAENAWTCYVKLNLRDLIYRGSHQLNELRKTLQRSGSSFVSGY